jgi:hypothetical protein
LIVEITSGQSKALRASPKSVPKRKPVSRCVTRHMRNACTWAPSARSERAAAAAANRYAELVRGIPDVEVLGPAPAPIARVNAEWRYRIAVKASDGSELRRYLRETLLPPARADRTARLAANVDRDEPTGKALGE